MHELASERSGPVRSGPVRWIEGFAGLPSTNRHPKFVAQLQFCGELVVAHGHLRMDSLNPVAGDRVCQAAGVGRPADMITLSGQVRHSHNYASVAQFRLGNSADRHVHPLICEKSDHVSG